MYSDIEEIIESVNKFKTNIECSNSLYNLLEETSNQLKESKINVEKERETLLKRINDLSSNIENNFIEYDGKIYELLNYLKNQLSQNIKNEFNSMSFCLTNEHEKYTKIITDYVQESNLHYERNIAKNLRDEFNLLRTDLISYNKQDIKAIADHLQKLESKVEESQNKIKKSIVTITFLLVLFMTLVIYFLFS